MLDLGLNLTPTPRRISNNYWWPAGAVVDLDFANQRFMRGGQTMDASEFQVSSGTLDLNAQGILIPSPQSVWLDVSAQDLEAAGTVVFTGISGADDISGARLWSLSDVNNNGNDFVFTQLYGGYAKVGSKYKADGGTIYGAATIDFVRAQYFKFSTSWDTTDIRHALDGSASLVQATGTALNANKLNRLYIGSNYVGTASFEGRIERITIYAKKTP